jgi:phenylalanyl-tRNA synthetase beta chain
LSLGRDAIGVVGEVHPDVLDAYGVDERVAVLELESVGAAGQRGQGAVWKPTSRFPSSDLDLAFATPTP